MIGFYKYTGPVQVFSIILWIIVLRLPIFIIAPPVITEDLYHMVVGQKLAEGALLYRDLFTSTAPIPAFVYWILNALFGQSYLSYYIVSTVFIIIQTLIFRVVCNNNDLLASKSDYPTLMYAICSFICFDFMSLSPAMISMTFILVAFNNIFLHIRKENNEGETFATGFYIGLAYLSFAPSLIFIAMGLLSFMLYTRTPFRFYALLTLGFLFPTLTLMVGFYMADGLGAFLNCFVFNFPPMVLFAGNFNISVVLILVLPSLLLVGLGVFRVFAYTRFINFQEICSQIMFSCMGISLLVIILFFSKTVSSFFLIAPFAAFFMAHYLILSKRAFVKNFLILTTLIMATQFSYAYLKISLANLNTMDFNHQLVREIPNAAMYRGKRILVIGDQIAAYHNARLATPFLDYDISAPILGNMQWYSNVERTYEYFQSDPPDVIIDQQNHMPSIFKRVVPLRSLYKRDPVTQFYFRNP